jgi:hypothetical protein
MPGIHFKHLMGADLKTHSTATAFLFIEFQGNHTFEIGQTIHLQTPIPISYAIRREAIHMRKPPPTIPISRGRAQRISLFTPESEVYVDAPVKFIAR